MSAFPCAITLADRPSSGAPEWSLGPIPVSPSVTLSVCLSAASRSCFSGVQGQSSAVAGAPVAGPPLNLMFSVSGTTVTLNWTPPGFQDASVISYIIEVASTPNFLAPDLVSLDTLSSSTTLEASGVAAGTYYVRVRALASGCPASAASNELAITVTGSAGNPGNPLVTLTLVYNCSRCTGDRDNYALNVDCVNGRCTTFWTSNATRSGTVTASVRVAPGVHNVEVVARVASWTLTISASPPGSGGMLPGSWRILDPPGGAGLSVQACRMSGTAFEMFTEFMVSSAGGTC